MYPPVCIGNISSLYLARSPWLFPPAVDICDLCVYYCSPRDAISLCLPSEIQDTQALQSVFSYPLGGARISSLSRGVFEASLSFNSLTIVFTDTGRHYQHSPLLT